MKSGLFIWSHSTEQGKHFFYNSMNVNIMNEIKAYIFQSGQT